MKNGMAWLANEEKIDRAAHRIMNDWESAGFRFETSYAHSYNVDDSTYNLTLSMSFHSEPNMNFEHLLILHETFKTRNINFERNKVCNGCATCGLGEKFSVTINVNDIKVDNLEHLVVEE